MLQDSVYIHEYCRFGFVFYISLVMSVVFLFLGVFNNASSII